MDLEKEVYTTFEAASICNANITSIKNWIDKGELPAFRTPGGHYRIQRKVLDDFLNRHGMPNPFADRERRRILLVHSDGSLLDKLATEFGTKHDYDGTDNAVDALLKIGQWKPDAAVIYTGIDELDVVGLCERVREHADLRPVHLIIVHEKDEELEARLTKSGADFMVRKSGGVSEIFEAVRRALL